jgi:integrase
LLDKGNTPKHADQTRTRIRAILKGLKADHLGDLDAAAVSRYLAERRELPRNQGGLSIASSNHHVRALKGFCNWLVKERRAIENPVAHLSMMNAKADRRVERRALEADELRWLLDETTRGPERFGMSGHERAIVYRLAVETGLRASELRSLTRENFELNSEEPSATVAAAYSKRRQEDRLPLRAETAMVLRQFLRNKLPAARVLNCRRATRRPTCCGRIWQRPVRPGSTTPTARPNGSSANGPRSWLRSTIPATL